MKELYCIVCPNGCRLKIEEIAGAAGGEAGAANAGGAGGKYRVTGNKCGRGVDFAIAEVTGPTRSITTTVRTRFPLAPALPVRSAGEIPKASVPELMRFLGTVSITTAVGIGDIIAHHPLNLEIDIVATSDVLKEAAQ
jgi:CxxC motif-containing protein